MMRSRIVITTIIVALAISAFVAVIGFFIPDSWQTGRFSELVMAATGLVAAGVSILFMTILNGGQAAGNQSHYIAFIGMPGSGKTSLIVSLFQEIFSRHITSVKATLRGDSTISRVNEEIMRKEMGLAPLRTTDQTMFSFRVDIESRKRLVNLVYRMEFGDYPGELSEQLTERHHFDHLRKTEYFEWCMRADAYVFIVDVAKYLMSTDRDAFVAESNKTIRESWQLFLDSKYKTAASLAKRPVLVIFTKMDVAELIDIKADTRKTGYIRDSEILKKAYSPNGNRVHDIQQDKYKFLQSELRDRYSELFSYLGSESKSFSVLYCSSYGKIGNRFADVQKMLKLLLPVSLR